MQQSYVFAVAPPGEPQVGRGCGEMCGTPLWHHDQPLLRCSLWRRQAWYRGEGTLLNWREESRGVYPCQSCCYASSS